MARPTTMEIIQKRRIYKLGYQVLRSIEMNMQLLDPEHPNFTVLMEQLVRDHAEFTRYYAEAAMHLSVKHRLQTLNNELFLKQIDRESELYHQ